MADQILMPQILLGSTGAPVSGALIYVYDEGTTTPKTVYTDDGLTTPHDTPIEADGDGAPPPIFLSGTCKVDAKTPEGVSLPGFPRDNYPTTPTTGGAASLTSFSPQTGNAATTVQAAIENTLYTSGENAPFQITWMTEQQIDASGISTTSTTEVALSAGLTYVPTSDSSKVRVDFIAEYMAEAADDPRANVRVKRFDGSTYVGGTNTIVVGGENIAPAAGNARIYGTVQETLVYSVSDRRSDTGAITVRLYGEASSSGVTVTIYSLKATFTEFDDAAV